CRRTDEYADSDTIQEIVSEQVAKDHYREHRPGNGRYPLQRFRGQRRTLRVEKRLRSGAIIAPSRIINDANTTASAILFQRCAEEICSLSVKGFCCCCAR